MGFLGVCLSLLNNINNFQQQYFLPPSAPSPPPTPLKLFMSLLKTISDKVVQHRCSLQNSLKLELHKRREQQPFTRTNCNKAHQAKKRIEKVVTIIYQILNPTIATTRISIYWGLTALSKKSQMPCLLSRSIWPYSALNQVLLILNSISNLEVWRLVGGLFDFFFLALPKHSFSSC